MSENTLLDSIQNLPPHINGAIVLVFIILTAILVLTRKGPFQVIGRILRYVGKLVRIIFNQVLRILRFMRILKKAKVPKFSTTGSSNLGPSVGVAFARTITEETETEITLKSSFETTISHLEYIISEQNEDIQRNYPDISGPLKNKLHNFKDEAIKELVAQFLTIAPATEPEADQEKLTDLLHQPNEDDASLEETYLKLKQVLLYKALDKLTDRQRYELNILKKLPLEKRNEYIDLDSRAVNELGRAKDNLKRLDGLLFTKLDLKDIKDDIPYTDEDKVGSSGTATNSKMTDQDLAKALYFFEFDVPVRHKINPQLLFEDVQASNIIELFRFSDRKHYYVLTQMRKLINANIMKLAVILSTIVFVVFVANIFFAETISFSSVIPDTNANAAVEKPQNNKQQPTNGEAQKPASKPDKKQETSPNLNEKTDIEKTDVKDTKQPPLEKEQKPVTAEETAKEVPESEQKTDSKPEAKPETPLDQSNEIRNDKASEQPPVKEEQEADSKTDVKTEPSQDQSAETEGNSDTSQSPAKEEQKPQAEQEPAVEEKTEKPETQATDKTDPERVPANGEVKANEQSESSTNEPAKQQPASEKQSPEPSPEPAQEPAQEPANDTPEAEKPETQNQEQDKQSSLNQHQPMIMSFQVLGKQYISKHMACTNGRKDCPEAEQRMMVMVQLPFINWDFELIDYPVIVTANSIDKAIFGILSCLFGIFIMWLFYEKEYKVYQEYNGTQLDNFMQKSLNRISVNYRIIAANTVQSVQRADSVDVMTQYSSKWSILLPWMAFRAFYLEFFLRNVMYQILRNSSYYLIFVPTIFFVVFLLTAIVFNINLDALFNMSIFFYLLFIILIARYYSYLKESVSFILDEIKENTWQEFHNLNIEKAITGYTEAWARNLKQWRDLHKND